MTMTAMLSLPPSPKGIHLASPDSKFVLLFASVLVTLFFLRAMDRGTVSQESCDMVQPSSMGPDVNASNPLPPHLRPGCILYSDNRAISAHAEATRGLTPAAAAAVAGWGAAPPILSLEDLAQLPLYAERHGYLFFESYEGVNASRRFRWHKVTLLRHALQCCCRWALYVDSDAYMRMDMHRLSVEDWAARASKRGYFDYLLGKSDSRLQAQVVHAERILEVLTPHDGEGEQGEDDEKEEELQEWQEKPAPEKSMGYNGEPENLYDPEHDWANSGVMLFGHSPDSFKFLDQWYEAMLPNYGDQRPMNLVALKWKKKIVVLPYLELTGPEGNMIRHFWHPVGADTRNYELQKALLGVLVQQQMEGRK
ncbi:unnamed protein product [Closterium sp. Naga37s-1]|nr:unnamed protein product [Closterium sp. Naga37s-1]